MSSQTTDVIVIGGGIMGTATAYHLAKRNIGVMLLEKTHLGAGSTGLTGGIIRQHYSIETSARMALRALKVWENFDEVVGGEVGFMRTGVVFLTGEEGAEGMVESVKMQQSIGIRTEMLDEETLKEIAPYLNTENVQVAIYEPDGGVADGSMACNAFAARTRELSGVIKQGVEVTGIRVQSGRVVGVDTSEGQIDAAAVVNTAGPWGPALARSVGVNVPAEPSRHQITSFKQPDDFEMPMHAVVGDLINAHYMRPDTGGLTLAGSLVDDTSDVVSDPDIFNQKVDRPFVEEMVEKSARRMPALERGGIQGGWAGLYTVTPDWNAIIDQVDGLPGLVLGLGFSGSGFKMGPVVGEMLADLATGDKQCPIDPGIFSLGRFEEGDGISSAYGYSIIG
ncbi:MAG: FAD-binding oxidoreductase [Anaerolineales bacterium]